MMGVISQNEIQKLISKVINKKQLTDKDLQQIDNHKSELIKVCNEHRAIPLFYDGYNQYKNKNPLFYKQLQKKFYGNIICQKKVDETVFKVLKDFEIQNISYVILKGFSLANSLYTKPYMRPFVDIDILIAPSETNKVKSIFQKHGFINSRGWQPKYIISQFTMYKRLTENLSCYFDIHEKISNDPKLAQIINYEIAKQSSFTKSINKTNITLINYKHAFIHACFHLVRHQYQGDLIRIIWLYDLHLILLELNEKETQELILEINNQQLNNIVKKALSLTLLNFPTLHSKTFNQKINPLNTSMYDYLLTPQSGISRFIFIFNESNSVKQKLLLIKETIFPPREEIENKYGIKKSFTLPFYYLKRIVLGVLKWLK